jgi:quercetin dioxygenase-like cupin family protein
MAFRAIRPDDFEWITRPHEPGEPAAKGRRHRHPFQEETFVVLAGTLTMYLGDPPERRDVPRGGLIHVEPRTPLQTVNHGEEDLLVYVYGTPPEDEHAELLDSAL